MVDIGAASIFDIVSLTGGRGWARWRLVREMWRRGESFAFHAAGELVAVAGLYPLQGGVGELITGYPQLLKALRPSEPDVAEVWFEPGPLAHVHMRGVVRLARLTLQAAPYRRIVCNCTSSEGVHFARLTGLRLSARHELGELWECPGSLMP